jgi:hypothetical protein
MLCVHLCFGLCDTGREFHTQANLAVFDHRYGHAIQLYITYVTDNKLLYRLP